MTTSICPERQSLHDYAVGRVSDEVAEILAEHLDSCPDCRAELATLDDASDTLIGRLRHPAEDPYRAESQCRLALARARSLGGAADVSSQAISAPMRQLGEYELLAELGRGGMGRVYLALHTKLDRVVAIKVLPRGRLDAPQAVARFAREMKAIGRLNHPNIVHAYDAREIDGKAVLVMEYVDGFDLAELVGRLGPPPVAEACELIRLAALALQYAHEHGLVHRDVKPSNLMLSRGGEVKLLDLGLARFYADPPTGEEMTGTGQAMGTADYMAPEQATDSRTVDIRADLYSLGCTLYKLLAGRAPFAGPEYAGTLEKLHAHVHQPAPPVRQFAPQVPEQLAAVLDRLLAKKRDDRYAAPVEVAAALEPFCLGADLPALAERAAARAPSAITAGVVGNNAGQTLPSIPHGQARPVRWRPWLWATAIGLLLALACGFALGIIITIRKNGHATHVEVPPGSDVRLDADGNIECMPPRPTAAAVEDEGAREKAALRLKQIGLALHNYHDTYKSFPPAVLHGPNGTPYSWRVAILPFLEFLEHADLYEQYRRNEPWNSPDNLEVLQRMPDVYRAPFAPAESTSAMVFALAGPGTAWDPEPVKVLGDMMGGGGVMGMEMPGHAEGIRAARKPGMPPSANPAERSTGVRIRDFTDGTSNTILLVQARREIPWTKPEDISYDPQTPLPRPSGFFTEGFHALFADGSVHFLSKDLDDTALRAAITRAGNEPLRDWKTINGVETFKSVAVPRPRLPAVPAQGGAMEPMLPDRPEIVTEVRVPAGGWVVESVEADQIADFTLQNVHAAFGGEPISARNVVRIDIGRDITFHVPKGLSVSIHYRMDPTQSPATLDLVEPSSHIGLGPAFAYGIYRWEDDRLMLCLVENLPGVVGDQRPKDFTVEPGSRRICYTLRRPGEETARETRPDGPPSEETGPPADAAAELAALRGNWRIVRAEVGQTVDSRLFLAPSDYPPIDNPGNVDRLQIDGTRFTFFDMEAARSVPYQYQIDPSTSPKTLDLWSYPPPADRVRPELLGIYELDGRQLRVCLSKYLPMVAGQQRPEDFVVEPGSGEVLFALEREEPSEDEKAIRAAWDFVSVTKDGHDLPPEQFKSRRLDFSEFHFFMPIRKPDGNWKIGSAGLYTLRSDEQSKAISLYARGAYLAQFAPMLFDGLESTEHMDLLGIYELVGQRLRIAYRKGGPRPTEFESKPGSGVTLLELRKAEPYASTAPSTTGPDSPPNEEVQENADFDAAAELRNLVDLWKVADVQRGSAAEFRDNLGGFDGMDYLEIDHIAGKTFLSAFTIEKATGWGYPCTIDPIKSPKMICSYPRLMDRS